MTRIALMTTSPWLSYAADIADTLTAHGYDDLTVIVGRARPERPSLRSLLGRALGRRQNAERILASLNVPVVRYPHPLHHKAVVSDLARRQIGVMVNTWGPIFRGPTIAQAKLGLVNCHMGLLPWFRGINIAEWSILFDAPIGNTVHLIDPGIDTGPILRFYPVDVSECPSISAMRSKLVALNATHIAETISDWLAGRLTPLRQDPAAGKQYFRMHPWLLMEVEKKLAAGYKLKHPWLPPKHSVARAP